MVYSTGFSYGRIRVTTGNKVDAGTEMFLQVNNVNGMDVDFVLSIAVLRPLRLQGQ
jgi:hypothetical protein